MGSLRRDIKKRLPECCPDYDRLIVQGTFPIFCYAQGMTKYLHVRGIRIFDFAQFAKPLSEAIKENAEAVAAAKKNR